MATKVKEALKYDTGKLRFDLIPIYPLYRLAEVYSIGGIKYADENWREGISWKRIYAALLRHATAWAAGESTDPKDGQQHLASVAWAAFTLMEYEKTKKKFDDRVLSMSPEEALLLTGHVSPLLRKGPKKKKSRVSSKTTKKR